MSKSTTNEVLMKITSFLSAKTTVLCNCSRSMHYSPVVEEGTKETGIEVVKYGN